MKRRKDRYNPYKIFKIEDKYILEFKNYYNRKQKIEITKEIAEKEGCSVRAVQYSLNIALKNLKNFLN